MGVEAVLAVPHKAWSLGLIVSDAVVDEFRNNICDILCLGYSAVFSYSTSTAVSISVRCKLHAYLFAGLSS